jgi:hypothetical protein
MAEYPKPLWASMGRDEGRDFTARTRLSYADSAPAAHLASHSRVRASQPAAQPTTSSMKRRSARSAKSHEPHSPSRSLSVRGNPNLLIFEGASYWFQLREACAACYLTRIYAGGAGD